MISVSEYSQQVVTWACSVLKKAGWYFDSNGDGSWDIETPTGWETAETVNQLAKIARRSQNPSNNG